MNTRADPLDITKTYKLFIDGKFPRSESGRTLVVTSIDGQTLAHVCRASRKDVRDAVTAARKALPGWLNATAYNRGQILYRMAEMIEGKRGEFVELLKSGTPSTGPARDAKKKRATGKALARASGSSGLRFSAEDEVRCAIDRLIGYAGWSDKFQQVLGCNNPVAGPYYNFTVPQATGVVGVLAPDEPGLLGLISLIAPALVAGNTVVALGGGGMGAGGGGASLATTVLGEVLATSDLPPGVVNLLTGLRDELAPIFASHRDIDAIHAAGVTDDQARILREGAAENVKRVTIRSGIDWFNDAACEHPWWIERFVEFKTIWHPSAV